MITYVKQLFCEVLESFKIARLSSRDNKHSSRILVHLRSILTLEQIRPIHCWSKIVVLKHRGQDQLIQN